MKITYVDDEPSERRKFARSMEFENDQVNVVGLEPCFTLDETYRLIMDGGPIEAIISDYELSDNCQTEFTGAELIQYFLERHPMLPCFVLTAFEDNAIASNEVDVYNVYAKSILNVRTNSGSDAAPVISSLYSRIFEQIEKTKRRMVEIEQEFSDLNQLQGKENWTSDLEDRLIELDGIIERTNGGVKISGLLKKHDHTQKVIELIAVTKQLLGAVEDGD